MALAKELALHKPNPGVGAACPTPFAEVMTLPRVLSLSSPACSPFSCLSPQSFCNPLYVGSLVPSYLLMAAAAAWAYLLSGGSAQNLRRFLLCKCCSRKGAGGTLGLMGCQDWGWDDERLSPWLKRGHHPLVSQTRGAGGF